MHEPGNVYPRDLASAYFVFQRPPSHQNELAVAPYGGERLPGLEQQAEVLFPGDAADVGNQQVV